MALRSIARRLQQEHGEPVVVENSPGAGGNIGMDMVIAPPADGTTPGLATNSVVINLLLYPETMHFDAQTGFITIAKLARSWGNDQKSRCEKM